MNKDKALSLFLNMLRQSRNTKHKYLNALRKFKDQ